MDTHILSGLTKKMEVLVVADKEITPMALMHEIILIPQP